MYNGGAVMLFRVKSAVAFPDVKLWNDFNL